MKCSLPCFQIVQLYFSSEHSELLKQIDQATDVKLREDLERELDRLVARMETKGEQIAILKQHERKPSQQKKSKNDAHNNHKRSLSLKGSEVEVVTTIKTKSKTPKSEPRRCRTSTNEMRLNKKPNNLEVFKKVQKLQGTLRQDDLSWDWIMQSFIELNVIMWRL